jgi:transposase-like protein
MTVPSEDFYDTLYYIQNRIEKWFQTATMRIDSFHWSWRGSQRSAKQWLRRFRHHYNHKRPNQALDGRTPAGEIQNYSNR